MLQDDIYFIIGYIVTCLYMYYFYIHLCFSKMFSIFVFVNESASQRRKISNTQPQKRGGVQNQREYHIIWQSI